MNTVLEHMSALADPTRCRMLLLLEKHELTVSELCAVLQMPQSSVSRHLKTLADDDWVSVAPRRHEPVLQHAGRRPRSARPAGSGRSSANRRPRRPPPATTSGGFAACSTAAVPSRRSSSRRAAGEWDQLRAGALRRHVLPLGGARPDRPDARRRRPRLRNGSAQRNDRAVRAACHCRGRLSGHARRRAPAADVASDNVELRQGELEALPLADGELDVAMLSLVLHYSPEPQRALEEVARVRPAGWPGARRRHAAARSRGISAADGPRVARVFREADRTLPHGRGIRRCAREAATSRSGCEGPGTVRRGRHALGAQVPPDDTPRH